MSRDHRPPQRTFVLLSLERLEVREVPTVNTWIGTSDDFSNAAYWTDGVPTPDDVLVFTGFVSPSPPPPSPPGLPGGPPGGQQSLPAPYSNQSVTFPDADDPDYEPEYAGIRILNGYAGTVTFPTDVAFDEYTQNSGSTSQAADTVVSISSTFGWVGGSINTSSNAATYELLSVVMGQIGEDTTELSSGSKFVLDSNIPGIGSYVKQAGILNILNGLGIEVLEGSTFGQEQLINQQNNKPAANVNELLAKGVVYDKGGKLTSVKVDGGHLFVAEGGLEVTGKVPGTDWSVFVTPTGAGRVSIHNGVTLKVANGLYMNCAGGGLITLLSEEGPLTATIEGKFKFLDGVINLGEENAGPGHAFSSLVVTEDAQLWGGMFEPYVNPLTSAECDFIKSDKKLDILSAFTISPKYHGEFEPYTGGAWPVLQSQDGFTDGDNPTNGNLFDWDMYRSEDEKNWLVKWDPI